MSSTVTYLPQTNQKGCSHATDNVPNPVWLNKDNNQWRKKINSNFLSDQERNTCSKSLSVAISAISAYYLKQ